MSRSNFTAIIVGGSVAGLTLAHTFEKAGINYVLLEARDTIAPQLGAGIVIMPNAARILDQMGIYECMGTFLTRMKVQYRRRADDGKVVHQADWPKLVQDRLGYPCGIAERATFLRSLYEQLEDKSKIELSRKVVQIRNEKDYVKVICADGTEVIGSVVVGADGIHSKVREEMQRAGGESGSGSMDKDKTSVKAEYNCFFGISTPMPSLSPGDGHTASDIDHSSLVFVSKHGLPQWFFFSKMDKVYEGSSIPRYTKAQMEATVEEFKDFHFTEDVTLKDLMSTTTSLSYLPLEEATFDNWTYGRAVCVGDAIHKMTPNLGQGGNQAIESATVLTNCFVELLSQSDNPTTIELERALRKYQDLRKKRAKHFVRISGMISRDDALATVRHTLRFLYLPLPTAEENADLQVALYNEASYLKFLPLPARLAGNKYWSEGLEKEKDMERESSKYVLAGENSSIRKPSC